MRKKNKEEVMLGEFMSGIIAAMRSCGRERTSETYAAAFNSFRHFFGGDIELSALTSEVVEAYEAHLYSRGLVRNSVSFYMRILRAVYNRAADSGIVPSAHPFRRVYTGVDRTAKRALPVSVIARICDFPLSDRRHLAYARDMFMLSFYMRGISFVDMAFLRTEQLRGGRVCYRRRKTGQTMSVAWTAEMQAIVDHYKPSAPYLLPIISPNTVHVRSAYRNASYTINRNLKTVGEMCGVDCPLTMYVARHSWASAAHSRGIPLSVISEGLGHDSESTTRIYLASLDYAEIDRANSLVIGSLDTWRK